MILFFFFLNKYNMGVEYCNYKFTYPTITNFYKAIDANFDSLRDSVEHIQYQIKHDGVFQCRSYPARGPIPIYAMCISCLNESTKDSIKDHRDDCCGPFDNYVLTKNPEIREEYKLQILELGIQDPKDDDVLYSNIFPASNENTHTVKQRTYFYNSLCFKTKSNIIVKFSPNNITFTNVKGCDQYHVDIQMILKKLKILDGTITCTLIRGNHKIDVPDPNIILQFDDTLVQDIVPNGVVIKKNEINDRNEYIFKCALGTSTCTIKLTRTGSYFYYITGDRNLMQPIIDNLNAYQFEMVKRSKSIRLGKVRKMKNGMQPNACPTTKHPTNKPVIAVRPCPFSYHGEPAMRNQDIIQEGKKNKQGFYEPCCAKITLSTKLKNDPHFVKFQMNNSKQHRYTLLSMTPSNNAQDNDELIDSSLNKIKNQNSIAHKMLRRLWYGFPNEVFPDDLAEVNEIDEHDLKCAIDVERRMHIGLMQFETQENHDRVLNFVMECVDSLRTNDLKLNAYIPFYIVKKDANRKIIELLHPVDKTQLKLFYENLPLDTQLILPNKQLFNQIKKDQMYYFMIHYYLEFNRYYIIAQNPFVFVDPIRPVARSFTREEFEDDLYKLNIELEL
jgi:hypothetical protein